MLFVQDANIRPTIIIIIKSVSIAKNIGNTVIKRFFIAFRLFHTFQMKSKIWFLI